MNKLTLVNGRYEGRLDDGRLLCVLPDVFEMNKGLFSEKELHDPQEWLSSADGENCWIEERQDLFRQDDDELSPEDITAIREAMSQPSLGPYTFEQLCQVLEEARQS